MEQQSLLPDPEAMYRALVDRDRSFEGIFFAGIRTTGIFCRPTCHARKPLRDNVEFFPTPREAMLHGYRPCKICRPLDLAGAPPGWIQPVLDRIAENPTEKMKDFHLRELGLEPSRVRRWFQKEFGMTFHAYCRAIRISNAFGRVNRGSSVTETAFESGYDSLSGFTDSFKRHFGFSPTHNPGTTLIAVTQVATPLGPMLAGATNLGICLLEFIDRRMLETQLSSLKRLLKGEVLPGTSSFFDSLRAELQEYFEGTREEFETPIHDVGTEFQRQVWTVLRGIPYGTTRSYGQQAAILGNPKAVRAVARANGENRIAIIIPCHRVIGHDGKLVGYGGGLWRKEFLLNLERKRMQNTG